PSIKFHAKPSAGEQRGQSKQKQPDRVCRYHAFDANPPALISKIATATGWKIEGWRSFGQPRRPHQTVTSIPASPVIPPSTPFRNPTPASAGAPPTVTPLCRPPDYADLSLELSLAAVIAASESA